MVIGEEPHVAYNRVGLTSFFEHRKVENLYLNPTEWVDLTHTAVYFAYEAKVSLIVSVIRRRKSELPSEHAGNRDISRREGR